MKNIILCADDYAYNASISQGILNLASTKCLSAVSCIVNMPGWKEDAEKLKVHKEIDVGLHFNLTDGKAFSRKLNFTNDDRCFPRLKKILLWSYLQKLSLEEITSELEAQLETFQKYLGRAPDFIDGHQHIHQFPIIRKTLLKVYLKKFSNKQVYIRVPSNGLWKDSFTSPKAFIIGLTGAQTLRKLLDENSIPHNTSFAGAYNLAPHSYAQRFSKFLNRLQNNGLLMCHPGLASDDKTDPIRQTRQIEYNYLLTKNFAEDNIRLARFTNTLSSTPNFS